MTVLDVQASLRYTGHVKLLNARLGEVPTSEDLSI